MIPQKQGREPFRLATSTMAPTPLHNLWAPQWPSMFRNSRKSFPLFVFARLGQKIVQEGWAEAVALLETEQITFEAAGTSHARKQHQLRAHLDM